CGPERSGAESPPKGWSSLKPRQSTDRSTEKAMSNNANDDFEDLHKDLPADEREYMQRCHKPHGVCFHCGQAANQHHPVGPITITVSDPDGDESTHEFCNWATGPLSVPVACPSLSG